MEIIVTPFSDQPYQKKNNHDKLTTANIEKEKKKRTKKPKESFLTLMV